MLALAPSALEALVTYSWRGNVRELQNCIERAVILTEGTGIHAHHLKLSFAETPVVSPDTSEGESPWSRIDLSGSMADASRRVVAEVERRKIAQALKEASGNPGLAAEILQIGFKTLQVKLKELEIS